MTELICGCLRRLIRDLFLLAFIDELPPTSPRLRTVGR
jgi:hypothetical protein